MQTTPPSAVLNPAAPSPARTPSCGELWRDPRGDEWLIRSNDHGQLCLTRPLKDIDLTGWHDAGNAYTDLVGQNWLPITGDRCEVWLSRPVAGTVLTGWELALEACP